MFDLKNKKILVTGATGGIGKAISKLLFKMGATLVLSGTKLQNLENLKNELLLDDKDENRIHVLPVNLISDSDINVFISKVNEEMNGIDVLINNAGITKDNLSMRMTDKEWEDVIKVNLEAPFKLIKGFIRGMIKNKSGRIINISSVVGFAGNPGQANYCATKAGIVGMSKALAREYASRNITVNCVAPGFIESAMTDVLSEEQKNSLLKSIPLSRMGKPEDIAFAVAFLASDFSSYITGQTIHVNGGMEMY